MSLSSVTFKCHSGGGALYTSLSRSGAQGSGRILPGSSQYLPLLLHAFDCCCVLPVAVCVTAIQAQNWHLSCIVSPPSGIGISGKQIHMPTVPISICLSSFADDIELKHDWAGKWWLTPMEHEPYVDSTQPPSHAASIPHSL